MTAAALEVGLVVRHTAKPEWGFGKILSIDAAKLEVYFLERPGTGANAVCRIGRDYWHLLVPAEVQSAGGRATS